MRKYAEWDEYHLTCGAEIDGITTPTPFNYETIDDFYTEEEANLIKKEIEATFPGKDYATPCHIKREHLMNLTTRY